MIIFIRLLEERARRCARLAEQCQNERARRIMQLLSEDFAREAAQRRQVLVGGAKAAAVFAVPAAAGKTPAQAGQGAPVTRESASTA